VIAQLTYQTAGGDFVQVPTYLGSSATNQDYINYGFNLKYGISNSKFKSKSDKGFNNLNSGLTYQAKKENSSPSLIIGGGVDLIQRVAFKDNHKENLNFRGYSFFATSYYTVDPIVFLY